jgi:hypothetical protein
LQRQARFADPTQADQREQPRPVEQPPHLGQLALPPYKARDRRG